MTSSAIPSTWAFSGKLRFLAISVAAAVTAASAAHASTLLTVPVWAMFMGWVTYYTRGHSGRDGLFNYACLVLGIGLGLLAVAAVGALAPSLGSYALPIVVLVIATLVVSLRAVPMLSNIPAYFLGLITVFAAHVPLGTVRRV
jgi:beta-lactamase regulating signal transducer with metallopeptidase domain